MKIKTPAAIAALLSTVLALHAKEPVPLIAKPGKQLLAQDFSLPSMPANWQPGGRPKSFSVADGALQGICQPDDSHGPAIGVPIEGRNLSVRFSVRVTTPGLVLFLIDGESQFGGQAHLFRLGLGGNFATLQQDRGSPASKQAQAAEKAKAAKEGLKPPQPTQEQLADPAFYRTETLARKPVSLAPAKWHEVLVEINGNDVAAQVDGVALRAKGSVFDAKKSRLVFLVGLGGTMRVDNVKVWENAPLK